MPLSYQGFNYILFTTCEISNYVHGIPIHNANAVTILVVMHQIYMYPPLQDTQHLSWFIYTNWQTILTLNIAHLQHLSGSLDNYMKIMKRVLMS